MNFQCLSRSVVVNLMSSKKRVKCVEYIDEWDKVPTVLSSDKGTKVLYICFYMIKKFSVFIIGLIF